MLSCPGKLSLGFDETPMKRRLDGAHQISAAVGQEMYYLIGLI
jgi:hypothetical protein